jgi:ubiquinone/menaquinone biosynthesis C-methylase UbiE
MPSLLTPTRRRGVEFLDDPGCAPAVRERSLVDVARSNRLFGGTRAVLAELDVALDGASSAVTLLDVGAGLGDIPARAQERAGRRGVRLTAFGLDGVASLAAAAGQRLDAAVCADALTLPFADRSVDIVTCSQLLHHFADGDEHRLVRELDRVACRRVIISDLQRSWVAAAGLWVASFPLGFHPISRHDGVVSVLRGFTANELVELVRHAVGRGAQVRRRPGFRITASWTPA